MKIVGLIARILLGLIFLVFGINGFLHFIPMQMPQGVAGQFAGAMAQSHYMAVVSALQVLGALLLLANRYVPLGLTILAPIIVNILLFHLFMQPPAIPGAVLIALWLVVFSRVKTAFSGLFLQRVPE